MLDGLVQHEGQQPGSVCHGHSQIPLLLKELIQLVPLPESKNKKAFAIWTSSLLLHSLLKTAARYHSDSLQVDLGTPQLLPAVVFVTLPL